MIKLCNEHPRYKALREPRSGCEVCNAAWLMREVIADARKTETTRDELVRMHSELSVEHGNLIGARNKELETWKKGILDITRIVWDTKTTSANRIRRLQDDHLPREYLIELESQAAAGES